MHAGRAVLSGIIAWRSNDLLRLINEHERTVGGKLGDQACCIC